MIDTLITPADKAAQVIADMRNGKFLLDEFRQQIAESVHVNLRLAETNSDHDADVFVEMGSVCLVLTPSMGGYLGYDNETHECDGKTFHHDELKAAIEAMPDPKNANSARSCLALIQSTAQVIYSYLVSQNRR